MMLVMRMNVGKRSFVFQDTSNVPRATPNTTTDTTAPSPNPDATGSSTTNTTEPSTSPDVTNSLSTTELAQLRDALSKTRANVENNTHEISKLRTAADGLSASTQGQTMRLDGVVNTMEIHGSSISHMKARIDALRKNYQSVVDSAATTPSDNVTNDSDLRNAVEANTRVIGSVRSDVGQLRKTMESIPQLVDQSDAIKKLNNDVGVNAYNVLRANESVKALQTAFAALPRHVDYSDDLDKLRAEAATRGGKLVALSDGIASVNTRVDSLAATVDGLSSVPSAGTSLSTLFDNVSPVCSTVFMVFAPKGSYSGGMYSGSGCFITLSDSDLRHGLFLTCAHNVISTIENTVQSAKEVYIENPLTNEWLQVTPDMVFVDGVGDIALIKSGINFVGSKCKPLKLATDYAKTGDRCIVVGDPAMMDSDSMSCGIVRSARYEMKPIAYQINECLHTDAPTVGGSSGSPMLNENGEIIAMLTYGHDGASTFGGGPNASSIKKSLSVLSKFRNNTEKKYLGLVWGVVYPTTLASLKRKQPSLSLTTSGVQIYRVNTLSPFQKILYPGDIITEVETYDKSGRRNGPFRIGVHDGEVPLGFLLYEYDVKRLKVTYISGNTGSVNQRNVSLSKTYADVAHVYDVPLSTGLRTPLKENPLTES